MACRKCHRDHEPVSLAEWSWQVRDFKPKPPPGHLGVLWMLAAVLDVRTGCGWASREQVAEAAGVHPNTVDAALRWGQGQFLIRRVTRGHRTGDGAVRASEWQLLHPTQVTPSCELRPPSQVTAGSELTPPQLTNPGASTHKSGGLNSQPTVTQARPLQERPNPSSSRGSLFTRLHAARPSVTDERFSKLWDNLREAKASGRVKTPHGLLGWALDAFEASDPEPLDDLLRDFLDEYRSEPDSERREVEPQW